MNNEIYLKHALQMLALVLYGALGALFSILPIMVVSWMAFTWNHMSEYGPVLALMFGMTVGLVANRFRGRPCISIYC